MECQQHQCLLPFHGRWGAFLSIFNFTVCFAGMVPVKQSLGRHLLWQPYIYEKSCFVLLVLTVPSSAKCSAGIKYSALCCLRDQELSNNFDKTLPSVEQGLWEYEINQIRELSSIKSVTTETEDSHKGNWQAQCLQSPVVSPGIHMPSVCGQ